jgi:hypothetical protein
MAMAVRRERKGRATRERDRGGRRSVVFVM